MQGDLGKHRLYLHRPASTLLHIYSFRGQIDPKRFRDCISSAMHAHEHLCQKVSISDEGEATFEALEEPQVRVEIEEYEPPESDEEETLVDIAFQWAEESVRYNFDVFSGEMIKHVLLTDGESFVWGIASHYLAGDAKSIQFMVRDVLKLMDDKAFVLGTVPWEPLDSANVPNENKLFFTAKRQVRKMNQEWLRSAKSFGPRDRERMSKNFHEAYPMHILHERLDKKTFQALQNLCREKRIHFSALLAAAYYKASSDTDNVHFTVSTRKPGYEGVGIYQGGIQVEYPKFTGDLMSLAHKISIKMAEKLDNPNAVHHSAIVLQGIEGTLIDAGYYAAYDGLKNKSAQTIQGMYGISSAGKGFQISNLGVIYSEEEFNFASLEEVYFLAPFIPNFARMIGVITIGDTMTITHACYVDPDFERLVLERAKEQLLRLL